MRFHKVDSSFWIDEETRMWDVKTKQLAIYILTNQHRNSEGLFRLPKYYIAGDLNFKIDEINEIIDTLIQSDFIEYDDQNSIILIKKALKYDPTKNKNHQKAAVKKLQELPKSDLFLDFLKLAEKYNKSFAVYLKKEMSDFFEDRTLSNSNESYGINDAIPDGIEDEMCDSLELELEPELEPEQTLEQEIKNNDLFKSDIILFNDQNSESSKEKVVEPNPLNKQAVFLTEKLIDLIVSNNSRASVPKKDEQNKLFKKWVKSIERLERLGPVGAKAEENKGYSWEEIDKIIEFSQDDNFWKSNILSAAKLRKQVVTLENQMNRKIGSNTSESKMDMLAELYASAEDVETDE